VYNKHMMFMFKNRSGYEVSRGRGSVQSGLLSTGLLSLLVGLAIIAAPELLAYIVASFFVVTGITLLLTWWNLRR